MRPPRDDRYDTDQVYRAGYLAGAADACLEARDASRDPGDDMTRRRAWREGYEAGWRDYAVPT